MWQVNDIHRADACKITPAKFSGSKEVVPLHFRKVGTWEPVSLSSLPCYVPLDPCWLFIFVNRRYFSDIL